MAGFEPRSSGDGLKCCATTTAPTDNTLHKNMLHTRPNRDTPMKHTSLQTNTDVTGTYLHTYLPTYLPTYLQLELAIHRPYLISFKQNDKCSNQMSSSNTLNGQKANLEPASK